VNESYDAVVYDLDGTLVELVVDWGAVRRAVADVFADSSVDPAGRDLWSLLDVATEAGIAAEVEETIASHERDGARESRRLPAADRLPHDVPVSVCSLNCETACRIALETHDIADHVGAVVGRDTVPEHKPDPAPLLAALDRIGADPDGAVFVGDSRSDAETAAAAGTEFVWAADW
jgi:phosphoglycolate phosphatase